MRAKHPIAIALAACLLLSLALAPVSAHGATLTRKNSTLRYIAKAGEVNDIDISKSFFFVTVIRFHDDGAAIATDDPATCNVVNGDGLCEIAGVTKIYVNVKDRNDTVNVNASRDEELFLPVDIRTTLIGGRGIDILFGGKGRDKIKGNSGRDTLRGRRGVDRLKGGRGSDQLYALDGVADKRIACGGGKRDQVKFDHRLDPRPQKCELGAG